ncbi:MAG: bacteriocin family protein [Chloroflexi bacterium]|nr:bacteriocin family protein [Chloroflexota bacterium]
MYEFLLREDAPFEPELWAKIDAMVVEVIKSAIVGRRFVNMVGPLGWGTEVAPLTRFAEDEGAWVAQDAVYQPLVEIAADALIRGKHLAVAQASPYSVDLGAVALAATQVAREEDRLVLGGLLEAGKKNVIKLGDAAEFGATYKAATAAVAQIANNGFDGPYTMVLNPSRFAQIAGLMHQGYQELKMVEQLMRGGIFQTNVMPADRILVVSAKSWAFDMVVGQDAVTAWLGNNGLDHQLRVFETVLLRVKLPGAIAVIN